MDPRNLEKGRAYYMVTEEQGILEMQFLEVLASVIGSWTGDESKYRFEITDPGDAEPEDYVIGQRLSFGKAVLEGVVDSRDIAEIRYLKDQVERDEDALLLVENISSAEDWFRQPQYYKGTRIAQLEGDIAKNTERLEELKKEYPEEFV